MKKFIFSLLLGTLVFCNQVQARGYYRYTGQSDWVAPAIIGSLIGYGLSRPYYSPPQVYVPPAVYVAPTFPNPYSYVYHYVTIWDNYCYCYKTLLVPNQ